MDGSEGNRDGRGIPRERKGVFPPRVWLNKKELGRKEWNIVHFTIIPLY